VHLVVEQGCGGCGHGCRCKAEWGGPHAHWQAACPPFALPPTWSRQPAGHHVIAMLCLLWSNCLKQSWGGGLWGLCNRAFLCGRWEVCGATKGAIEDCLSVDRQWLGPPKVVSLLCAAACSTQVHVWTNQNEKRHYNNRQLKHFDGFT
jgi:hypothetical protein